MDHQYILFVTFLHEHYADRFISEMVRAGFSVQPAGQSGKIEEPNDNIGFLMAVNISSKEPAKKCLELIQSILYKIDAKYFSIIMTVVDCVSQGITNMWAGSNVSPVASKKPTSQKSLN